MFISNFKKAILTLIITMTTSTLTANPVQLNPGNVIHTVLDNGLNVIIKEDHSSPVTAVHIRIKAGSITEEGYFGGGLSHFFEHSLFLGSKNHPKPDSYSAEIESYGGANVNAYTSYDHTAFYFTILSKYTKKGLSSIEDLVFHPLFPKEEVTAEKGSILSEMDMRDDQVDSYFNKHLSSFIFKSLPYHYPVIGYKDRFNKLSTEELLDYYYKMYTPNNTILSVVGDFDSKEILAFIKKKFKKLKSKEVKKLHFEEELPWQNETGEMTHPNANYTRISFLWKTVSYFDNEMYPLDILASFLADGEGSILHHILKEKLDIIQDISSFSWTPRYNGIFEITASLTGNKSRDEIKKIISQIETEIYKSIEEIKNGKIDDYRLETVKREVLTSFIHERETAIGQASTLASSIMICGGINYDELYLEGIRNTTKQDIIDVTKRFLSASSMKRAIITHPDIVKEKPLYKNSTDIVNISDNGVKITKNKKDENISEKGIAPLTYDDAINKTKTFNNEGASKELAKTTLGNKLTVLYKHQNNLPKIVVILSAKGGLSVETGKIKNGSFDLLSGMFLTGNEQFSKEELIKFSKLNGISISPFSGKNSFGLKISFLSDKIKEASKLLKSIYDNKTFNKDDFSKEINNAIFHIKRKNENGWQLSGMEFKKDFFRGTPFENSVDGTIESVKSITIDELQNLKQLFMIPENMVLSVYGDISENDFKQSFLSIFEDSKNNNTLPTENITLSQIAYKNEKDIRKGSSTFNQSYFRLGYRAPSMDSPDYAAFKILSGHLSGMGGPIFKLRSQPFTNKNDKVIGGRAYQIGSIYDCSKNYGGLIFYAGLRYEAKDEYHWAIKSFTNIVEKLKTDKLSTAELNRAKLSVIGSEIVQAQMLSGQAFNENLYELYGYGYELYRKQLMELENITKVNIMETAKKYLATNGFTVYVLIPKENKKE